MLSLRSELRRSLVLPAVCAPMMIVSGPELVITACKSGIMAGLPRHNARSSEEFKSWLRQIAASLELHRNDNPDAIVGPVAINVTAKRPLNEIVPDIDFCIANGVRYFITALGNPTDLAMAIHDRGGVIFHDITNIRFAEKAIRAGVDGLICIGGGGGGHSGLLNALAFIPRVREMFDGLIIFAGGVSTGSAIRAAEVLGADLVYLGTRFIATRESRAPAEYKNMLVEASSSDLAFTARVSGVAANWLKPSLERVGLDLETLPPPTASYDHLPEGIRPWRDLWSAGQGVDLIDDVPEVSALVERLRREYVEACKTPDMSSVAELTHLHRTAVNG